MTTRMRQVRRLSAEGASINEEFPGKERYCFRDPSAVRNGAAEETTGELTSFTNLRRTDQAVEL